MEAYGNSMVSVLGKFYACSWGGKEESTSSYFMSWQPMHHQIYYQETVAIHARSAETLLLSGNLKEFAAHSLKLTWSNARCMVIWPNIWQRKELMRRSCLIPLSSLSKRSNFKASHWRSRTSFRVYSDVFTENWEVSRTSIQVPAKTKCKASYTCTEVCLQSISKKHSTRKSGTWNI